MSKRYGSTDPLVYINRDLQRRIVKLEKALLRTEVRLKSVTARLTKFERAFTDTEE